MSPQPSFVPDVLFHIGGPVLPNPLCGERDWTTLVNYRQCPSTFAADIPFCPECLKIRREQWRLANAVIVLPFRPALKTATSKDA